MGREVRRVPAHWEHPMDAKGHYIPLFDDSFAEAAERWDSDAALFAQGKRRDWTDDTKIVDLGDVQSETYAEYNGERPVESDYMPDWPEAERTHWQMYENVSEGTPISPVMATPEELARWLADNKANAGAGATASYEAWLATVHRGFAFSMMGIPGEGLMDGVTAMEKLDRLRTQGN